MTMERMTEVEWKKRSLEERKSRDERLGEARV